MRGKFFSDFVSNFENVGKQIQKFSFKRFEKKSHLEKSFRFRSGKITFIEYLKIFELLNHSHFGSIYFSRQVLSQVGTLAG